MEEEQGRQILKRERGVVRKSLTVGHDREYEDPNTTMKQLNLDLPNDTGLSFPFWYVAIFREARLPSWYVGT